MSGLTRWAFYAAVLVVAGLLAGLGYLIYHSLH